MEEHWQAERRMLRHLLTLHPDWTTPQLASCLGRSRSWIKKWRKRLREADPQDQQVLLGQSRARHTPPPAPDPLLVQRILELRDTPPEGLQRTPGPRAIAYYLPRHAEGLPPHVRLPRSSKPIWKILRQHGRIAPKRRPQPRSWEEREPLEEVQMDWHRTPPLCLPILVGKANGSRWWRSVILSMRAPRSGCTRR